MKNNLQNKKLKGRDPDYFIVGLQKSGTFWVTALLDAHPSIRCLPSHYRHSITKGKTGADEGRIFDMLATVPHDGGAALRNSFTNHHGGFFKTIVPKIGKISKQELHRLVRKRYRQWFTFHNPEKKSIVGDKTTEYVFHLDLLDSFFPHAKKVCILRDPKDRVVSWHYHQIRRGRKKTRAISGRFIREYFESRLLPEYDALLAYGGRIHCLTYEDLHRRPEATIRALLKFLGAAATPEHIRIMREKSSIERLREEDTLVQSSKKKQGAAVLQSHYRKGIAGDWKNHLSKSQARLIERETAKKHRAILKKYHSS